jgi:hypothetical protein
MPMHMAMVSETVSFWRFGPSRAMDKWDYLIFWLPTWKHQLTWMVLGSNPAVRSRRVEQFFMSLRWNHP